MKHSKIISTSLLLIAISACGIGKQNSSSNLTDARCSFFDRVEGEIGLNHSFTDSSDIFSVVLKITYNQQNLELVFDKHQPEAKKFAFYINENTCSREYQYSYKINYKNFKSYSSPQFTSTEVNNQVQLQGYPIWTVNADASQFNFEQYENKVALELQYVDSQNNISINPITYLSREKSTFHYSKVLDVDRLLNYNYRLTFYYQNQYVQTDWMEQSENTLKINDSLVELRHLSAEVDAEVFNHFDYLYIEFSHENYQKTESFDKNTLAHVWKILSLKNIKHPINYEITAIKGSKVVQINETLSAETLKVTTLMLQQ